MPGRTQQLVPTPRPHTGEMVEEETGDGGLTDGSEDKGGRAQGGEHDVGNDDAYGGPNQAEKVYQ